MKKDEYRNALLKQLDSIFSEVSKMKYLSLILDKGWRDTIEEIIQSNLEPLFSSNNSNKTWMFLELIHCLRGTDSLFEKAQRLHLERKGFELNDGQKMAFSGPDTLNVLLSVLEKRLNSYFTSGLNPQLLTDKFDLLINSRFSIRFPNYIFEILVLGVFANYGLLNGIEVPIGTQGSTIDGLIEIDNRLIYTEVTLTSQEILSTLPGVHAASTDDLCNQILNKVRKKVSDSRQIALVQSSPSLLVIGRNPKGADQTIAENVIKECFNDPEFHKLSGIIVSDNWKFQKAKFYEGTTPDIKLSQKEIEQIKSCL